MISAPGEVCPHLGKGLAKFGIGGLLLWGCLPAGVSKLYVDTLYWETCQFLCPFPESGPQKAAPTCYGLWSRTYMIQ